MLTVVSNGVVATVASRESCARKHCDGAEVLGLAARKTEAHGSAVGEAQRESLLLVDTKVVVDLLANSVDKGDIFTALVGPTFVQPIRGHEDGAVLRQCLESVVWGGAAVDRGHVSITPVKTEDQTVWLVLVVIVREADDPTALLAIDGDGLSATRQRGSFSTAGGTGMDTVEESQEKDGTKCEQRD